MNKQKKLIFLGSNIRVGKALLINFYDETEKKIMSTLLKKQTFLKRSLLHREKCLMNIKINTSKSGNLETFLLRFYNTFFYLKV